MDCHNNDNTSAGRYGSSVCGVRRSDCVWRHVGDNDDERIERLTDLLSDSVRFGQVFITDARKERTSLLLKDKYNAKIFEIGDGKVNSYGA